MKNVRILGILLFTVTNNVDRIQIILFLISFSFYFKKLLLNKLSDKQGNHIKNNLSVRES